jgi:hypothetical protein
MSGYMKKTALTLVALAAALLAVPVESRADDSRRPVLVTATGRRDSELGRLGPGPRS